MGTRKVQIALAFFLVAALGSLLLLADRSVTRDHEGLVPESPGSAAPKTSRVAAPDDLASPANDRVALRAGGQHGPEPERAPRGECSAISGVVLDDLDRPVAEVRVDLCAGSRTIKSDWSQPDGSFRFEGLGAAEYSVRVGTDSLPDGTLGPWMQHQVPPRRGNEYQARSVGVTEAAQEHVVELRVFASATAWGRIVGPRGESVEGVQVSLQGAADTGQPSSLHATSISGEDGRFALDGIYPGLYIVQLFPQRATNPRYRRMSAPIPRALEVAGAGRYDLGAIAIGAGTNSLAGRVVDERGAPFKGLPVIAYPAGSPGDGFMEFQLNSVLAEAETDGQGMYRFDGLSDGSIRIHVGNDYLEKPLGEAQAAFWIPPQEIRLDGGGLHRAADSVLPRSRPFRIFGAVQLDANWAAQEGVSFDDVEIELVLVDPDEPPVANRPTFHMFQNHEVDPGTGQFEILLETPHRAVRVRFSCARGRFGVVEEDVYDLPPNGELFLSPSFPTSAANG